MAVDLGRLILVASLSRVKSPHSGNIEEKWRFPQGAAPLNSGVQYLVKGPLGPDISLNLAVLFTCSQLCAPRAGPPFTAPGPRGHGHSHRSVESPHTGVLLKTDGAHKSCPTWHDGTPSQVPELFNELALGQKQMKQVWAVVRLRITNESYHN